MKILVTGAHGFVGKNLCAQLNNIKDGKARNYPVKISEVMDEKDPIDDQYSLEVSSPGLDRPLTKPQHFKRFLGYETKIETSVEVDGRKRFKGKTKSVSDNNDIVLEMDGKEYTIPFSDISKAKIVLTDELLAEYMAKHQNDEAIELVNE